MKIVIIDDNQAFREGFKFYLETKLGYDVIATFSDGEDFIKTNAYINSDIIFMDIEMPKIGGIEASKMALWRMPDLKIIAITGYKEKTYLTELVGAGCKGCVFKDNIYEQIEDAIEEVLKGNLYFPEDIKIN